MIVTCTRRLEIDAGHRVHGHEGKCAHLHGHRYRFDLTCVARQLDSVGRIVDFSVVKAKVGSWLDEHLDHKLLLYYDDPIAHRLRSLEGLVDESEVYVFRVNPTAENLARFVLELGNELLLETGVLVQAVRCWETPNCWADACLPIPAEGGDPLDLSAWSANRESTDA